MKKAKTKRTMTMVFVVALLALMASAAMAITDTDTQGLTITVSEIAVLDATASDPMTIALAVTAPSTGGDSVQVTAANATSYAQYTSVVSTVETVDQARTITAAVTTGDIPAGLKLNVTAGTPTGTGTIGSAAAGGQDFTIGALTGGTIVTAIGSCETGTEATNGAQLTYTLSVDNIANVKTTSETAITVTLTLTAGA